MQEQQYVELYDLIKTAFIEMQEMVKTSKDNHKYLFSHHDFPKLNSYRDNGMPNLSTFFGLMDQQTILHYLNPTMSTIIFTKKYHLLNKFLNTTQTIVVIL